METYTKCNYDIDKIEYTYTWTRLPRFTLVSFETWTWQSLENKHKIKNTAKFQSKFAFTEEI